jgi:hypothetical protein
MFLCRNIVYLIQNNLSLQETNKVEQIIEYVFSCQYPHYIDLIVQTQLLGLSESHDFDSLHNNCLQTSAEFQGNLS